MTVRLSLTDLGPLRRLASGGQGVVFDAPGVRMPYAPSLVFKQYKPEVARALDVRVLESMPAYLESLPFAEGMELLSLAAWPCRLAEEQGTVAGFVMPAIPDAFFLQMKKSSGMSREAAEFQHLLNDESFLARRAITVSDRDRYELLREVARALSVFHRHGIAVGDLSPKNLLFSCGPAPGVYFVDCDAMRFQGQSVMPQLETPGWEVRAASAHEELGTAASDSYKLGLLALRLLSGSQDTRDIASLPTTVPQAIQRLIAAALSADPTRRPHPADWIGPLDTAAATASTKTPRTPGTATAAPPRSPAPATARQPVATGTSGSVPAQHLTATPARTPAGQGSRSAAKSAPPSRHKRRRRTALIGGISVLAVAGAAIGTFVLLHHPAVPGAAAQPIAVSADGKTLASADTKIYLWDVATRRVVATLTDPQFHYAGDLAFSPDGKTLAIENSPDLYLWNAVSRRVVVTLTTPSGLSSPAFSPDGKILAAAGADNKVYLWDVAKLRLITTLQTLPRKVGYNGQINTGQITSIAFSPDSNTLAVSFYGGSGSYENQPGGELWDIATRRIVTEFPSNDTGDGLVFSPDGKTVVIDDSGGYFLWDVAQKKVRFTLSDPSPNVGTWHPAGDAATYSPNGKTLATADGSPNNSVFLWDVATGRMIGRLTDPNSQGVGALAYIQDGKTLAVSDGNGNIYLWDLATAHITATLTDPTSQQ